MNSTPSLLHCVARAMLETSVSSRITPKTMSEVLLASLQDWTAMIELVMRAKAEAEGRDSP